MLDQPSTNCILIVEDEPRLASVLCDYLHASGYGTEWVEDGAMVMDTFHRICPRLVLLDLMLPNRDGISLCRELRSESNVPVIMVTARVDEIDRLLGLEVGADDYICKPFSPREVVARVAAVLRRYEQNMTVPIIKLFIDSDKLTASFNGKPLDLTPVEYRLLCTLITSPRQVWSRDRLMDHLYPDNRIVSDRTIDSHIKNLRRKLVEAGAEQDPIRSIYGVGYYLDV